jgi:hypothetical protein
LPEWLIERGIGETRTALIAGGEIVEASILLDGVARAGTVVAAQLIRRGQGDRNAIARDESGTEYLLPRGADHVPEGSALNIRITREQIPGSEPWKRALAEVVSGHSRPEAQPLTRDLFTPGVEDRLANAGWYDLIEEARFGQIMFAGGALRVWATPAMTLIDIDGYLDPGPLAIEGAGSAARTIRRLDITGSIGIDFPTVRNKLARSKATDAIDHTLPQPFERTAINGFGFMQIVRRRRRASLIELAQDRPSFEARALLRRVGFEAAGAKRIVAHPAVVKILEAQRDWLDQLSRQVGGAVTLRADANLPMSGGYAEKG